MKSQLVFTTLAIFFLVAFTGCVSIDINPSKTTKADDYDYSKPKYPFDKISANQTDHTWQSSKTGNTISVLTACNKMEDPSLKTIESDILGSMKNAKVTTSDKASLKKIEALRTLVEGEVDTVNVQVLFYSTKRNNCTYSLTYVARKDLFESELPLFENFAQGFEFE